MKQLANSVSKLLGLLMFGALVALFVFTLQQGVDNSQSPTQSAYPGQSTAVSEAVSSNPYPGPSNTVDTFTACIQVGEWLTYTDQVVGYSFQYPAESRIEESPGGVDQGKAVYIFLRPQCYVQRCSGSKSLVVRALPNPNQLSVTEFLEEEFPESSTEGKYVTIGGVQALRFDDGFGSISPKPYIFIPHGQWIIRFYIDVASSVPPHDPPCGQTLKLLDEILASVQLSTP